jgi:hypothetical protein
MLIDYTKELQHLNKIRKGEIQEGYKLGIPEIDEFFRFKKANFNVILGQANVGKTSMALYLMLLYSLRHNIRWVVFSSENEPYSIIRKLMEYMLAEPINKMSDEAYKYAADVVGKFFKFISPEKLYTYKDLIKLGESYKAAWDYQGMLIDPYNSLIKDAEMSKTIDGHSYDYQAMTELRQFCKRNDISLWLNVHAVTGSIRMTHSMGHEYAGYPLPPSAGDVEGGAKFVNRADDFLTFHRYTQHPSDWNQTHMHIRKTKETESGGRPTPLDSPVKLRSLKNNVGFEIDGENILEKVLRNKKETKFAQANLRKA